MIAADGRGAETISRFIRAGSHNPLHNHAIAQSDDSGRTWTSARLLPLNGTTCQGSIGRDPKAPAGEVLLAAPSWPDSGLGGR